MFIKDLFLVPGVNTFIKEKNRDICFVTNIRKLDKVSYTYLVKTAVKKKYIFHRCTLETKLS